MRSALLSILLLLLLSSMADAARSYGNLDHVQFISVTSSDSFLANIPGRHPIIGDRIEVVLKGVEVPKKTGTCEQERQLAQASERLLSFMLGRAKNITLKNVERGRGFKIVATVLVDSHDIRQVLIKKGFAVKARSNKKSKDWCRKK